MVRPENAQLAEFTAKQPGPSQPPWHSCPQPMLAPNDLNLPSSLLSKQAGRLLLGLVAGTDDQNVLLISSQWWKQKEALRPGLGSWKSGQAGKALRLCWRGRGGFLRKSG